MTFEAFKKAAFDYARELSCECAEIYYVKQEHTEVQVLEGEVDGCSVSTTGGANLRVVLGGKNGYAYTEILQDAKELVARAVDNAKAIESTDERPMQAPCTYNEVSRAQCRGASMTTKELTAFALELENKAKAADARCIRVAMCAVDKSLCEVVLCNTLGLDAHFKYCNALYAVEPVLQDSGVLKNAYAVRYNNSFDDVDGCVKDAIRDAAAMFGAKSVSSGKYSIILRNDAMQSLLSAFWPVFSAELCQKKLSLLAGKENSKIAATCVSITDNPLHSINPRPFDDEGVPSVSTALLKNGILTSLLHDLKTAKKANCSSTSNGGRAAAQGAVTVMPSNLFIEPANLSLDELVAQMANGILITDLSGTHSGVSTTSGDFSLISSGFLVENGKIIRPVDQITIAGNFLTMLNGVCAIGKDLFFGMPDGSIIGAPSVLIDSLMVSGE